MAIFLKLSSSIGLPPWLVLPKRSYNNFNLRVTDGLTQKMTLRVTYALTHPGYLCADTWQIRVSTTKLKFLRGGFQWMN
jgi:hypothetical protein